MITIVCVETGNYLERGDEYVQKLYAGCARHLSVPFRFQCFSDRFRPLGPEILMRPLPEGLDGWWHKLALFQPGLFRDGQQVLFFDLDTLIVGSIDAIAEYSGRFAILSDFYRGKRTAGAWGSGVLSWTAGTVSHLWEDWNAAGRPMTGRGDQAWIERALGFEPDLWQDLFPGAFVSFKADGLACDPLPRAAAVVCYHGSPKPHTCGSQLSRDHWTR